MNETEARFFDDFQRRTIEAAMARIIPTDHQPGASEAGTIDFLDRYLSGIDYVYARPDGSGFTRLEGKRAEAWRQRIEIVRRKYLEGIEELNQRSRAEFGDDFAELAADQQDAILAMMERPVHDEERAREEEQAVAGFAPPEPALQQIAAEIDLDFFPLLVLHTRQGFLADPIYGGNRDRVGWDVIGFPGPSSLAEAHAGRYSTLPYFAETRAPQPARRPADELHVQTKRKPDRADVCIIGAGASGATAAKVLTEAGLRVVALERGPWWKPEQFSADELANVHRYNLWPDPLINPRTFRASASDEPVVQLFCPVPQMVGGGTAHWTGWLPRMTENEFRPKTIYGEVPGANLADWPITYQELEPYYDKVEWAFGVSGQAGANTYEGPRSRGYPCPPLPPTRYNQKFHEGCAKLGYNSFPTPSAALSCPYNGWPATNQSAFAQQHGDPTGTRGNALTRFIPAALATGRYDLRPDCYVQEITVDAQGRARSAVYWDAEGDTVEQEADLFILACGAIESARLLLLSRSSRFPNGLANGSDVVGRNATFHEYSAAIGAFEDPVYGWAGGGYVGASTFEFMEHAAGRDFVGGCHVASAGVGIPLPISFSLPDKPTWGQAAKDADREFFNHTMAVGLVLHDLPQETNRVELDDQVKDAWGLPVARITHTPHPNDLAQGRWIIDRNAEILEAAGATKVWRVYIDKVTGNCSHQHSTLRMGNDPNSSVLNKDCRAHEVDNLYAVDGSPFPTSTGVNPTLTIMANAWRVADSIVARRGSPD